MTKWIGKTISTSETPRSNNTLKQLKNRLAPKRQLKSLLNTLKAVRKSQNCSLRSDSSCRDPAWWSKQKGLGLNLISLRRWITLRSQLTFKRTRLKVQPWRVSTTRKAQNKDLRNSTTRQATRGVTRTHQHSRKTTFQSGWLVKRVQIWARSTL